MNVIQYPLVTLELPPPPFVLFPQEIRTPLINFARKEIAKSEMHQEIRLRSPGHSTAAGGATSGNLVGHLAHLPYLQRQLSQSCISVPVSDK